MKSIFRIAPVALFLAVAMGCSNMNGCMGTSSNNVTTCAPGTHPQLKPDGSSFWCVPG